MVNVLPNTWKGDILIWTARYTLTAPLPNDTDSISEPWISNTDVADLRDFGDDNLPDGNRDKDIEDEVVLFAGNKHSAGYYIKALEEFAFTA